MEQDEFQFKFIEVEDQEFESDMDSTDDSEERALKVRLDKWLWAARFFKTRALARSAVENGKVYYNGERSKPSREIEVEAILQIRHGRYEKTVIVKGLSTRRRSTEEALQLFEEIQENNPIQNAPEWQSIPMGQPMPYGNRNRTTRFQEQPYSAAPPTQNSKRRAVRFLRRSFVRNGEGQPIEQHNTHPAQGYRPTHSPHFNPHHAAGYHNQPMNHYNQSRQHPSAGNYVPQDNYNRFDQHNRHYAHGSGQNSYRQSNGNSHTLQHGNQYPYGQHGQPHSGSGYYHSKHQQPNQNYNYYGPQSYKEANGNIGHLPLKEIEIEESSD